MRYCGGAVPIMSYVKIRIACMFMSMQIILHAWTVSLNSMGVDPAKAADTLVKQDKQRANYYNFYSNQKWGNQKTMICW